MCVQGSEGFKARLNTFLSIASRHHIRPIFRHGFLGDGPKAGATASSDPGNP